MPYKGARRARGGGWNLKKTTGGVSRNARSGKPIRFRSKKAALNAMKAILWKDAHGGARTAAKSIIKRRK